MPLAGLMVAVALAAIVIHLHFERVRAARRLEELRVLAGPAARMHLGEVDRVEDLVSVERRDERAMSRWFKYVEENQLYQEENGVVIDIRRGGPAYLDALRDILPWQERWLDFHRRAADYYTEIDGGGNPSPSRATELAQAQAKLLKDRRDLAARHRGLADLLIPNWWNYTGEPSPLEGYMIPRGGIYYKPLDPLDVGESPDFNRPTHTFADAGE